MPRRPRPRTSSADTRPFGKRQAPAARVSGWRAVANSWQKRFYMKTISVRTGVPYSLPLVRFKRRTWPAYALLLPAMAVIFLVIGYPILFNLQLSLTDTKLLGRSGLGNFVGLANYIRIFQLPAFWDSIRVTLVFTAATVLFSFLIGLGVALILNEIGQRRGWMLTVMLIPWIVSPVIASYVWRFLFNDEFGLVNEMLIRLGLITERIAWLAKPSTTIMVIVVTAVWRLVPYMVLMLIAGLQSVPHELYEAAEMDGAGTLRRFYHITLSQLRYVIAVVVMFATIWTFNDFTIPYVMTVGGGTSATRTLPILAYQTGFQSLLFGRAAAMATIILLVLSGLSMLSIRLVQGANNQATGSPSLLRRLQMRVAAGRIS